MAAWTRPSPYGQPPLPPARPMDFDAIDTALANAGHTNEACGGWSYYPNTDPRKSLIICGCESVIPFPVEEVLGSERISDAA